MTTAIFIITSNNKTAQSLNRRHLVFPCTGVDTMADSSQLPQGGSKVRRSCQSTIVGGACAELRHSDRNLRTAWFEKGDFKIGIKKKTLHKTNKKTFLVNCWPSGKYVHLLYMYSILGRGSFCFNYCLNSAWHGGDQFVALLRWYGSPGFFDSGLQLICIFWSLVSHFPLDHGRC